MSKHTVLLADSSYTIRRIVELSFSEEKEIELITFESGTQLREKLIELTPDVVLVDIRLPEFNGYQVCKFINETDTLKQARVFLLKGGFEPVNENLLKELNYLDIITKPFDSNALVASVKESLEQVPAQTPESTPEEEIADSFPEDIPEISDFDEDPSGGISFSDIKEDMDSGQIPDPSAKKSDTEDFVKEEVLPSEEITQGAQPERDELRPETGDEMANPFAEDSRESNIDQLLEREIARERQAREDAAIQPPITEGFTFESQLPDSDSDMPPFQVDLDVPPASPEPSEEIPPTPTEPEKGIPDTLSEEELAQAFAEPQEAKQQDEIFTPSEPPSTEEEQPPPIPETRIPSKAETPYVIESTSLEPEPGEREPLHEDTEAERSFDSFKETPEPIQEELPSVGLETEEEHFDIPAESAPAATPNLNDPIPVAVPGDREEIPNKEELVRKMEDKLSTAVKEILWEVVPPLAEKIIKEEIERLEAEIDNQDG